MITDRGEQVSVPQSLRDLPVRAGMRPTIDVLYPCLQLEQTAPPSIRERVIQQSLRWPGVSTRDTVLSMDAAALVLASDLAKGQPEAFVTGHEFAIIREDGSIHLQLEPEWTRSALRGGWVTVHPLARYMAGAIPPQSLIVYAARDEAEVSVILRILEGAYAFAVGRIGNVPLADSMW